MDLDALINDKKPERSPAQRMEETLRIEILTGRLPAGRHIAEQSLCTRFGVSRTPVRDVLRHIEQEGLLEIQPNRGAVVKGFSRQDVDDLFYLKSILEVQCVRWAASRMRDDELETLTELFAFMEFYTLQQDMEKMTRINGGFDLAIYQGSHNQEILDTLLRYSFYLQYATAHVRFPADYLPTVLEEHRAIYEAILARDPEAAAAATEAHMFNTMVRRR